MDGHTMRGDVTVFCIVIVRWCEGKRKPIPCFGGCRGPEVTRTIKEIEHTFSKHLAGNETLYTCSPQDNPDT